MTSEISVELYRARTDQATFNFMAMMSPELFDGFKPISISQRSALDYAFTRVHKSMDFKLIAEYSPHQDGSLRSYCLTTGPRWLMDRLMDLPADSPLNDSPIFAAGVLAPALKKYGHLYSRRAIEHAVQEDI